MQVFFCDYCNSPLGSELYVFYIDKVNRKELLENKEYPGKQEIKHVCPECYKYTNQCFARRKKKVRKLNNELDDIIQVEKELNEKL